MVCVPQVDSLVVLRVWKRPSEHLIGSDSLLCLIVSSCIRVNGEEKALAKRSVCAKFKRSIVHPGRTNADNLSRNKRIR